MWFPAMQTICMHACGPYKKYILACGSQPCRLYACMHVVLVRSIYLHVVHAPAMQAIVTMYNRHACRCMVLRL